MTTPTTVSVRLQLRGDTAANWTSVNPTLLANELGRETDTGKIKIGDGSTAWTSLAYQAWATLPLAVASGGTGQTTYTNGQLLIGNTTGNTLTKATLTAGSGIAVTNGTGSITVAASEIADSNISATAEIAVSKLADGTARQLLQTDAAGTGVEWTSNVDIPGTLDVTSTATFDSIASFPLGNAGAPTITFTGDTNTGIYSPGADQVAISTNGSGRLFVDSSGRVGIGAAPGAVFHITQSAADAVARIDGGSSNTAFVDFRIAGSNKAYVGLGGLTGGSNNDLINYNSSAGNWIAYTNGSERMRLTSTGLLGLGTSAPQSIFHIGAAAPANSGVKAYTGLANSYEGFLFDYYYDTAAINRRVFDVVALGAGAAGAIGGSDIRFLTVPASATGTPLEAMRIDSAQRVGIGTTSPTELLHINGNMQVGWGTYRVASVFDNSYRQGLAFDSANRQLRVFSTTNDSGGSIGFYTRVGTGSSDTDYGTERARIDSSGRLLVGTSSARSNFFNGSVTAGLQAESTGEGSIVAAIRNVNDAATVPVFLLAKSRGGSVGSNTIVSSGDSLGYLSYQGSDGSEFVEAARIAGEVDGTPGANDMPGRLVFSTTADGASSPTERMRIGNTGILFTFSSASSTFIPRSSAAANTSNQLIQGAHSATSTQDGTISFIVYTNGNVENTNNSYGQISDIKLKENIVDANSQWDDLKSVRVRNFNFKEGQTHRQIGVIAQELEQVSPGLVYETPDRDEDGNETGEVTKGVSYSVLYMKAVKALQEAMERIETLEAKVAALEAA